MPAVGNFTPYPVFNGTNLVDLFNYGNLALNSAFGITILALSFLIIYISVSKIRPQKDALAISSWISGIFALLMWAVGSLSDAFTMVFIALMLISILLLWLRKDDEY